jgi:glycerol-3-phosphate dehydrogenase
VNLIGRVLGKTLSKSQTATTVLPGAAQAPTLLADLQKRELSEKTIHHFMHVYGSRTTEVLAVADEDPSWLAVIDDESGAVAAEVIYAFKNEGARTLQDCLMRRTMIGLNSSRGSNAVAAIEKILQEHMKIT